MLDEPMSSFVYSVWFRDAGVPADDEDHEWVACIGIESARAAEALEWGDTLARDYSRRSPNTFLRSAVELESEMRGVADWTSLPRIQAGETATDAAIGW
jgi:hypothetical protein